MALTCDHCLAGNSWRCHGGDCANTKGNREAPTTNVSEFTTSTPKRHHAKPYKPGKFRAKEDPMVPKTHVKTDLPEPLENAIRDALTEGETQASIFKRMDGRQAPSRSQISDLA